MASGRTEAEKRTSRVRTIDTHAHWYPSEWLKVFERDGAAEGARLERGGSAYVVRTERIVNAFDEEFVDLDLRLAGMARQGVDVHALSLTTPMVNWASPELGLALACYPAAQLIDEARVLARAISEKAPMSIAFAKRLLQCGPDLDYPAALERETEAILACMKSEDWEEGIRAFVEKRTPAFKGE